MNGDVFDDCKQIRTDWVEGRHDAGPSKKCPGGYSIPANKNCGGAEEGRPQPGQKGYKRSAAKRILTGTAQGAQKGGEIGTRVASGISVGKSVYDLGNKRMRARTTMEEYNLKSRKKAAEAAAAGGTIGALAGGVVGGTRAAVKEYSAYRKARKSRKA